MNRRTPILIGMLLAVATLAGAEQLTTVGIINIDRIYNSFYRDSQEVRELDRLRREYQDEIDSHVRELETLRQRLNTALDQNNRSTSDRLQTQVAEKERFIEDLARRRRAQLEARQARLLSDDFLNRLQQAIQFVAESGGYTLVLRTDTEGLQWWSSAIDISDQVLARLRTMTR
ncbi:MAG: OmpH family outer membrane protein [Spirochaetaceae bacterium]|nr:MAG: OmpH family outer membrane protein [Spirochaetaceae bacterium]